MTKETEQQTQHPGSDSSKATNKGSKKQFLNVGLSQSIGLFAGPKLAHTLSQVNRDLREGANLSFIPLMDQLVGSNISFFIKGLALHNAFEVEIAKSPSFFAPESVMESSTWYTRREA
jgi:hypothetical protein